MKMTKYYLLAVALLLSTLSLAQGQGSNSQQGDSFGIRRTISFSKESKPETVVLDVSKKTNVFNINIDGRISDGLLVVEIRNPKNVIQGEFKINTQLSADYEEDVMARINKQIKNPEAGEWKVLLKPTKAEGRVMIVTESN